MQIGRMDEIVLLANERDQLIFRHEEAKDDVLLAAVADDRLGDDVSHASRKTQAADGGEEEGGIGVHAGGEMGDEPLRAAQHLAEVVIAAQLEDPVDLREGENGEDLVVDVGELDGELLGGEEAVAGDAHQDERRLVQEGDDGVRRPDRADRVARINHVGHQSLRKRTRLKQCSGFGFGFVFNFITASGSGTVFRTKEA